MKLTISTEITPSVSQIKAFLNEYNWVETGTHNNFIIFEDDYKIKLQVPIKEDFVDYDIRVQELIQSLSLLLGEDEYTIYLKIMNPRKQAIVLNWGLWL